MSLTTRPYLTLLEIHRAAGSSNPDRVREQFNVLPQEMRNRIFGHIYDLAGSPQDAQWGWGETHVFDSLPRLQSAVQRVAFESFDSLMTFQRNMAAGRVYTHAGSPSTGDFRWGETHAKDDAGRLLQSLDDIRTNLSASEIKVMLKQGNTSWLAIGRIEGFVNFPYGIELSLDHMTFGEICPLPHIFHADIFTTRLKELYLSNNYLTSLPEQIGQLKKLEILFLDHNPLTALPEQIDQLQALRKLNVRCNRLISLPEQIGQLRALSELDVGINRLTTLPEQIGRLQALRKLDVSYNHQLQSLPVQIGQLRALLTLNYQGNGLLTGVPLQILDLPSSCTIDLQRTGLSEAVLARLLAVASAHDYRGPRFSFSMENSEARTEERPTAGLLTELFSLVGRPSREFPNLFNAGQRQRQSLQSWLSRLSYTADYKKGGERQKAFARKVLSYMQLAEENPQYRDVFFMTIEDASQTCGDRIALSVLKLGVAFRLMTMDKWNLDGLAAFLIKTVWPVQMLEEIARNKVPALPFFDEIEVYLAYPVKLKEMLGLEIDVEEMLYFTCSALKQQDLDDAAEFVKRKQADRDAVLGFLIENADWMKGLKVKYPEEMKAIEQEVEDAIAFADSSAAYNAAQSRRKERLKALSERHLQM